MALPDELLELVKAGDLDEVEHLCQLYPYLLKSNGAEYLQAVSETGNMEMARALVRHGAKPGIDAEDTARANGFNELADFLNRNWPGERARG
jgi:hypothetical protein